ncbi:MAG: surface-adhesin E family protein [Caulobacteraceae bacterium]
MAPIDQRQLLRRCVWAASFLSLCVTSADAESAEWWLVATAGTPVRIVTFVDEKSIQQVDTLRRAWVDIFYRKIPPPANRVYSSKVFYEFDCQNRQLGILSELDYDIEGNVINSANSPYPSMTFVAPETIGAEQMDFVCAESGARPTWALDLKGFDPEKLGDGLMGNGSLASPQPPARSRKNVPRVYHPG